MPPRKINIPSPDIATPDNTLSVWNGSSLTIAVHLHDSRGPILRLNGKYRTLLEMNAVLDRGKTVTRS